jgi:hypothetical protein
MDKIKEKQKIYKDKVHEIMTASSSNEIARRVQISTWYDMYYNNFENSQYSKLLARHEFEQKESERPAVRGVTPFVKINLDNISPKIKLILGDLEARGFEPKVVAKNQGAFKRKKAYRAVMQYLSEMQPYFQQLEQQTGMPLGINERVPKNEDELNELMQEYRDVYEILMESAMNDVLDKEHFNLQRLAFMTDLMITNEMHGITEVQDGRLTLRRINPLNILPDLNSDKSLLNDRTMVVEAYYMPVQKVLQEYGVKKDDMVELMKQYKAGNFEGWWSSGNENRGLVPFFNIPDSPGFESTGYNRVLVVKAQWLDMKDMNMKSTYDQYDNLHVHTYTEKKAKLTKKEEQDSRNETISKPMTTVEYCVLVAGDLVADCGTKKNSIRSFESPQDTGLDYVSIIADYNNMKSVSLVERMKGLQDFKNYVMTLLQKQITNNFGNYTEVDLSLIDNETYGADAHTMKRVLIALSASNIIVTNTAKDKGAYTGLSSQNKKAVTSHESPLVGVIQTYIPILSYLDSQMDVVSGMNEARQGQTGERSLVGTTQMKMVQSSLMTEVYFTHYFTWEKEFLKKLCYQIAMQWADEPDKYRHIADMHNITLPEDFEIDIQDWSIEIDQRPMSREDIKRVMEAGILQGNFTTEDYFIVMYATQRSMKEGIRLYLNIMKKRREQARLDAIAERKAKEEQDERNRQAMIERDMGKANVNAQALNQAANTKAATDRYKADIGAEVALEQMNSQEYQTAVDNYGADN